MPVPHRAREGEAPQPVAPTDAVIRDAVGYPAGNRPPDGGPITRPRHPAHL